VERVTLCGSAGTYLPPVDVPRTLLNIGALVAITLCIGTAFIRIVTGGPLLATMTYASLAGIEIGWLVGRTILITSQD